jgi:hypothetical protein
MMTSQGGWADVPKIARDLQPALMQSRDCSLYVSAAVLLLTRCFAPCQLLGCVPQMA